MLSSTSCLAMSTQPPVTLAMSLSLSQLRSALWAYAAAGVACVILVVVTNPTDLPRFEMKVGYKSYSYSNFCRAMGIMLYKKLV